MSTKIHTKDTQASATSRKAAALDVQTKLKVGTPGDRFEREADHAAEKVINGDNTGHLQASNTTGAIVRNISRLGAEFGKTGEDKKNFQAEEDIVRTKQMQEDRRKTLQKEEEKITGDTRQLQRQEEGPKEAAQTKLQRQEEGLKEAAQTKLQRQEEGLKEAAQTKLQRKEEGPEEPTQAKLQRQEEGPEEPAQTKLQRQEEGPEEPAQTKLQRQEEGPEEAAQTKLQSGKSDEPAVEKDKQDETAQTKSGPRAGLADRLSNPFVHKIESRLQYTRGKGAPLPDGVRMEMEARFGVDFQKIRIHTGADARQMSTDLNAQAFTSGGDIYFNAGKYDPESLEGKRLLAHELTHTIQQDAAKAKDAAGTAEMPSEPRPLNIGTASAGMGSVPASPTAAQPTPVPGKTETELPEKTPEKGAEPAGPVQEPAATSGEPTAGEGAAARPLSPEEDPNFQALQERTEQTAKEQKAHRPSGELAQNAGDAAPLPPNEVTGEAQAAQVNEMQEQEPGLFDAATFKKMLLEQIQKILPKNEEEADDFAEDNQMDEVKSAASQKVEEEKTNAAGAIEESSAREPDTSAVTPREPVPLEPPKPGAKPAPLEAGNAMPPARPESEVNQPLDENAQEVDNEMAANNVTDEQLARSEEPSFLGALESKKNAQEHSKTAPDGFRQQEQGVLDTSKKDSEAAEAEQLAGMRNSRVGLFNAAAGVQAETSKGNTSERARIATEIDAIYEKTKTDVETRLDKLDAHVELAFDLANDAAQLSFENYVDAKMDAYKDARYGSWYNPVGLVRRAGDALTGMPDEVNKFFMEGRDLYINQMDVALTRIAEHIASELKAAKERIEQGKNDVQKYVDALPANLKKYGKEKQEEIQDKFAALADSVVSKQEELIDTIATKYKESLAEVDARIEEMKAANRGLIDKAIDAVKGVIETIKKLKQLIENLLSAIKSVISVIMDDPIGFMKDLFGGIGQGIDNFSANIKEHLIAGLFKWLTGALGPMGITIPENLFSLSGIFNLIMQVLGLGWDFIRQKAVKMLGEPAVAALEKGFELFQLFRTKGIDGIWEYMKEQFQDLKATVLDAIQDMIITQVIQAGIKWLLSLLIPGAGFIKAIMAIKDLIVFFVESAIALIPALIDAIKAAAARNMAMIAKAIENGLALLIPLVINLLAKLIGISGLANKVQKIIKNIRKRIDRQVNKLLAKAKKWVRKMFKKGKDVVKKGIKKLLALINWRKKKHSIKSKTGEKHQLYYLESGKAGELIIASNPKNVIKFISEKKKEKTENPAAPFSVEDVNKAETLYVTEIKPLEDKLIKSDKNYAKENGKTQASIEKKNKNANENKKISQDLDKLNASLAKILARMVDANAAEYPPPKLPTMTDNKKASSFTAEFIVKKGKGKKVEYKYGVDTGTESGEHIGNLEGWSDLQGAKLTQGGAKWVRMHLLPHKLGGDAVDSNLTPARGSISNTPFSHAVEQPAIKQAIENSINDRKPIWYKFSISYHSGKYKAFPSFIEAQYGIYDNENGAWKKGPTLAGKSQNPEPPEFEVRIPNINDPKTTASEIKSASDVDLGFAKIILNVRDELGYSIGTNLVKFNQNMNAKYIGLDDRGNKYYKYGIKNYDMRLNAVMNAISSGKITLK